MNFFNKIKSYGFWVSFSSSLIVLLTALGKLFGFSVENQLVEDCVMSIASVLAVLGIVTMNDNKDDKIDEDDLSEDLTEDEESDEENKKDDKNDTMNK